MVLLDTCTLLWLAADQKKLSVPIITCDPLIAQYPDVRVVW